MKLHFIMKVTVRTITCYYLLFNISSFAETNVQLLIKEKAKKGNRVNFGTYQIAPETTYLEFLRGIPVMIDRTLWLNFILNRILGEKEAGGSFAITAPSRWGKTTMLKMTEFFFMPELNEKFKKIRTKKSNAYQFFEKGEVLTKSGKKDSFNTFPLISSKKIGRKLDAYIGQHPVVNLDLLYIYTTQGSYKSVVSRTFKMVLDVAVDKYIPLIEHLCATKRTIDSKVVESIGVLQKNCRLFNRTSQIIPEEANDINVYELLTVLLDLLCAFYKKKVIVLIDEYSSLMYDAHIPQQKGARMLSVEERADIQNFFEYFLSSFIKTSKTTLSKTTPTTLLFAMMTGIVPIAFTGLTGLKTVVKFHNFMDEELYQFYGLQHDIAIELMEYAGFNHSTRKQYTALFDHYEIPCKIGTTRFNPYSLLETVYGTEVKYPWLSTTSTQFLELVVRMNEEIRDMVQALVLGACLNYEHIPNIQFETSELLNIGNQAITKNTTTYVRDNFLRYLVQMGFLTVTKQTQYLTRILQNPEEILKKEEQKVNTEDICVKIPNLENTILISKVLVDYDVTHNNILGTSLILAEMLYDHSTTYDQFEMNLKSFLKEGNHLIHGSELYYHSLLLVNIILPLGTIYNYKYLADYRLNDEDKSTPDIMLHNETHGGIFEVKYNVIPSVFNKSYDEQLPRYGTIFHKAYSNVTHLRLMLVHVEEERIQGKAELSITVTTKERCISKSIEFKKLREIYEANENKGKRKQGKTRAKLPTIEVQQRKRKQEKTRAKSPTTEVQQR